MEEQKRGAAPVEGEEMPEPRVDALVDELKKLQLGRTMIEDKINSVKSLYDSLTRQHDALQIKASQLDEIYNLKQEMCHKLNFQCKEFEQESIKLVEENRRVMELLRQYRCEIQEVKLKHRKQSPWMRARWSSTTRNSRGAVIRRSEETRRKQRWQFSVLQ
ncbi:uncharacterized protein si:ch211-199g17.9 isoform X2 [Synchiropus splendidus]|uniref:uncharacterized protein si:ch211-199g17.9 isoform X2 n=1 Tax=Synchiropus splendidus TaxID=270530 RepID=UPI00237E8D1C|nr:uncharacterized protein si:ch211-199g17.9 isoform X2 [Synchiropus splendidus]